MTTHSRFRRRWQTIASALVLIAFVSALIGLGRQTAAADETAQASTAGRVGIDHFAFHPPTLRVGVGSKVVFANTSGVAHTATRRGSFDTGHIKPGKSVSVRFKRKGTFAYHCTIHPFMHGKIVVE